MDLRGRIDDALERFLDEQEKIVAETEPAALPAIGEIRRLVAAGGKRLRPLFCYWGYRAAGGPDGEEIVRAAAALELLHTFAIVHDDFMDRSPLRRGLPSSHEALGGGHAGASAAILAGDLAFVLADRMLCEAGFPAERLVAALRWFTRMRVEVVVGQYADMAAAAGGGADERAARRIAALKSGSYTVEKPLAIGAALAGAPAETIEALAGFGRPLGEAFQLRDDVIGAFGDATQTGKDAEADLREGKRTVLVAKARALASDADRAFLDERLGAADLSRADLERLRGVLRDSGALAATVALVDELYGEALAVLRAGGFDAESADALAGLAGEAARLSVP